LSLPVVLTGGADPDERQHIHEIISKIRNPKPRGARQTAEGSPQGEAGKPSQFEICNLSGRLTLLQLASVIGRARLVVSVDSAAMHLAAMEERPQVALFGPTNPFHWRPRHANARVVAASDKEEDFGPRSGTAPMSALSTTRVMAAIDSLLAATGPAVKTNT
jgi:ADP-heptose:LPS heptosyltransferase